MRNDFFLNHFRFHLEPKAPLRIPEYNTGDVIRGGFGTTFRRIVCHADYKDRARNRARERRLHSRPGDLRGMFLNEKNYESSL
jgi:hypothetical protein